MAKQDDIMLTWKQHQKNLATSRGFIEQADRLIQAAIGCSNHIGLLVDQIRLLKQTFEHEHQERLRHKFDWQTTLPKQTQRKIRGREAPRKVLKEVTEKR